MNILGYFGFRSGDIAQSSPGRKRSRGDVQSLYAINSGTIEHYGDTRTAIAQKAGVILVRQGVITQEVRAVSSGRVIGQVADEVSVLVASASVVLVGNPKQLTIYDHGNAIVFGTPQELNVYNSNVSIVTPCTGYQPQGNAEGEYSLTYLLPPDEHERYPVVGAPPNIVRSFELCSPLPESPELLVIQGLFTACNRLTFTPDGERYF
jgi:hypothetical protein